MRKSSTNYLPVFPLSSSINKHLSFGCHTVQNINILIYVQNKMSRKTQIDALKRNCETQTNWPSLPKENMWSISRGEG